MDMTQAGEPVFVQAFIPEPPVERFDVGALIGLARLDEEELNATGMRPGAIQIRDVNAQVIWTSASLGLNGPIQPAANRTMPGQSLLKGQDIYSQDKTTRFSMQTDDNLVLYQNRGEQWAPIWAAGSNGPGNSAYKCKLFADGDLAVLTYFSNNKWASGIGGHPTCWLDVESGRIVLRHNGGIVKVLP
ncbi:hypothetical protein HNO92_000354 [Chromobacterium alkanivorans]|nr:hypothetical protein [Chromobacterium alkanivorans]